MFDLSDITRFGFSSISDPERLALLNAQIAYAAANSPYYRETLGQIAPLTALRDITCLPFLTPEILRALEPLLSALPDDIKAVKDGTIGKFAKRPGICIVASVGTFKGRRGLDLRQWQEDVGFTKKGIWLPLEKLPEIKKLFAATRQALDEKPEDDF